MGPVTGIQVALLLVAAPATGPCRVGNRGEKDGDGLQIVTRVGGEFRHQTDQGSR